MKISKEILRQVRSKRINLAKIRDIDAQKIGTGIRRALYSPYLYLTLGLVIGLLFTIQLKTGLSRPMNPVLFLNQLTETRLDFLSKKEELNEEAKKLQKEIEEKEGLLKEKNLVSSPIISGINEQELLLGLTVVEGEGVTVIISDGESQIKDEFSKSLAHAADLRDIVNLLWYSGAEAISINNERIIFNTSIDCIVSTILINNNNYVPPFTIKAIGNQRDLIGILNNSRKLVDIKKRADKKQINFEVIKESRVRIERHSGVYSSL